MIARLLGVQIPGFENSKIFTTENIDDSSLMQENGPISSPTSNATMTTQSLTTSTPSSILPATSSSTTSTSMDTKSITSSTSQSVQSTTTSKMDILDNAVTSIGPDNELQLQWVRILWSEGTINFDENY